MGTGLPLRDLLVHGRLYCHDFRDRIFSFVSLANDCVGLKEVIVDYSAEMWELFFGLLEIFRSSTLVSFACSLHNLLEVPSLLLIEFFNSPTSESATATELQRLSQMFKMKVKGQKTSYGGNAELFDGLFRFDLGDNEAFVQRHVLKLPDVEFYPICASLSQNFDTWTKNIFECFIGNSNLHIRFRPTIFGFVLKDILDLDGVGGDEPNYWDWEPTQASVELMITGLQSNIDRQYFCSKLQRVYNRLISNNQVSSIAFASL
jgi:hypothetical protein